MYKQEDNFHLYLISGLIAAICRDTLSTICFLLKLIKYPIWAVAGNIFLKQDQLYTPLGIIVGITADFVIAGTLGIIIGLLIDWKGTKYVWLKGVGVGLGAWVYLYGILFHDLPKTIDFAAKDPQTNFISIVLHSIYGVIAAYTYVKIRKSK